MIIIVVYTGILVTYFFFLLHMTIGNNKFYNSSKRHKVDKYDKIIKNKVQITE